MTEQPGALPGGFVNAVVRVADTVRRPVPAAGEFVHELLRFLEQCGWTGAPRHLGTDEQGREILTFIHGQVAWEKAQARAVRGDESLAAVARLVREFHDLTAGTALAADQEVVCHNDLSPRNTVYRDLGAGLRPVAFIDWDIAAPGSRIHDVAHVCWQYVGLGPETGDAAEAARQVRVVAHAYGLADRGGLVDAVLWWQDRCWRGIEAGAQEGQSAMVRLRETGVVREVQAQHAWTFAHRGVLARG